MSKRFCTRCHRYYPGTRADSPDCGPPWWRNPLHLPGHRPVASSPTKDRLGDILKPAGIAGLILLAIYRLNGAMIESDQRAAQEQAVADRRAAQAAQQEEAACRQSAKCWGDKHYAFATVACMRRVDLAAQYAARWPSGLFNPVFLNWEWRDQAGGTLVYIGRVELQNGFGAWAPYIVGCLYDPATGAATDLELRPGRL